MSAYAVNKVCHLVGKDEAFRKSLDADPAAVLAAFDLSEDERAALIGGEVGRLYELGAHGYLLGHLTRHETLGITVEKFGDRMTRAKDDRIAPLEAAGYLVGRS